MLHIYVIPFAYFEAYRYNFAFYQHTLEFNYNIYSICKYYNVIQSYVLGASFWEIIKNTRGVLQYVTISSHSTDKDLRHFLLLFPFVFIVL